MSDLFVALKVQVRVWSPMVKDFAALEREFELNPAATFGGNGHMERAHVPPRLEWGFGGDFQKRSDAPLRGGRMEGIDVPFLLHLRETGVPLERYEEFLHQFGTLWGRDKDGAFSHIYGLGSLSLKYSRGRWSGTKISHFSTALRRA